MFCDVLLFAIVSGKCCTASLAPSPLLGQPAPRALPCPAVHCRAPRCSAAPCLAVLTLCWQARPLARHTPDLARVMTLPYSWTVSQQGVWILTSRRLQEHDKCVQYWKALSVNDVHLRARRVGFEGW